MNEKTYLNEEQTRLLCLALLATEERTTLETLAYSLDGRKGHERHLTRLENDAGHYDRVVWQAVEALTGKTSDTLSIYDYDNEVRAAAESVNEYGRPVSDPEELQFIDGFAQDDFIAYMLDKAPNAVTVPMLSRVIEYGRKNKNFSKDQFYYYLLNVIPEIDEREAAAFFSNEVLTADMRSKKAEFWQLVRPYIIGGATHET